MDIKIFCYTLEINYFPGSPGDAWTAPTEPDYEIVSMVDEEDGHTLTYDEEDDVLTERRHAEIWAAIKKKLEDEHES